MTLSSIIDGEYLWVPALIFAAATLELALAGTIYWPITALLTLGYVMGIIERKYMVALFYKAWALAISKGIPLRF